MIYLDSNFIVSTYLKTESSKRSRALARQLGAKEGFVVTWLTEVEVVNAIERMAFISRNDASRTRVSAALAAMAQGCFSDDLDAGKFLRRCPISVSDLVNESKQLALRHTGKLGVRSYDLLHVAQARLLGSSQFLSFDKKANELAKVEGLATIDEV